MVKRLAHVLAVSALLAGCDGNPFLEDSEGEGETPVNPVEELPGTTNPTAKKAITRYEDQTDSGDGYAKDFTYNSGTDTFTVDNLGFDGANSYSRSAALASLGPFQVYEGAPIVNDPRTGNPIEQFDHRLLAGVSASGRTSFAIVRTGAYTSYGFGGFVMKRSDAGVVLPSTGQATYSGRYAAVRDFSGVGGLEFAEGDMTVDIDFEDFNDGDAVKGVVRNRRIYDIDGNDITSGILAAMDAKYDPNDVAAPSTNLPTLVFAVGPGAIDVNGEIRGTLDSKILDYRSSGPPAPVVFEKGNYYAIVSGPDAAGQEVVGIIVVEAEESRLTGVTVRETGGFILYR